MATPRTSTTTTTSRDRYAALTVVSSDTPGTWSHPRLEEINRRVRASTFDESNIRAIIINSVLLALTFMIPRAFAQISWIASVGRYLDPVPQYLVLLAHLVPIYNITLTCMPLMRKPDELADIPLTPKQRSLLGLPHSNTPASPGSTYITPPRFSRSATPRSDASSRSASPYSGSRGASPIGTTGYSPSPLFQRAVNRDANRRLSFGNSPTRASPTPLLGQSTSLSAASMSASSLALNSPSPSNRGGNTGLPSKWLYERGRRSSSGYR